MVKPGRPINRLTVLEFAQVIGVKSRTTVYDQIGTPAIPERFIVRCGKRKILIEAAAVEHYAAYWREQRDGGVARR